MALQDDRIYIYDIDDGGNLLVLLPTELLTHFSHVHILRSLCNDRAPARVSEVSDLTSVGWIERRHIGHFFHSSLNTTTNLQAAGCRFGVCLWGLSEHKRAHSNNRTDASFHYVLKRAASFGHESLTGHMRYLRHPAVSRINRLAFSPSGGSRFPLRSRLFSCAAC